MAGGMIVSAILAVVSFFLNFVISILDYLKGIAQGALKWIDDDEDVSKMKYLLFNSSNVNDFVPPPPEQLKQISSLYNQVLSPEFFGLENIPTDKPVLFIGNHAIYALEYPVLLSKIYSEKGLVLRAAGDFFHRYMPYWPLFKYFGAFDGSKEACEELMKAKQTLIIFPGGGREVLKRKSDKKYELMWKERLGFAKIAIKHGYTIIPFASYGTEDMIEVLFDIPLKPLLGREMYLPIPKPIHPSKIQKVYFSFGKPISTEEYGRSDENLEFAKQLRDRTREGVLAQIDFLREVQQKDPNAKRFPEILRNLGF